MAKRTDTGASTASPTDATAATARPTRTGDEEAGTADRNATTSAHAQHEWTDRLSEEQIAFTTPEIMVKLIGTVQPDGYPHITLITSNVAEDATTIKWGQFTQGRSKRYVRSNPKQGILYMTAQRPFRFLQLKADWQRCSKEGADAAEFNQQQLFRYNTYMRIATVYFNRVVAAGPIRTIGIGGLLKGALTNFFARGGLRKSDGDERLPPFGDELFSSAFTPKFVAHIDADGYPIILPIFQARSIDRKRIVYPYTQFGADLASIQPGTTLAFFAMNTELMSILVMGTMREARRSRGVKYGIVEIEQVYNSMPPLPGQIYPTLDTREKVEAFHL